MKRFTKTSVATWALLLTAAMLAACAGSERGSGTVTAETIDVGTFERLRVDDGFDVTISAGDDGAVTVRSDDNVIDHVDVGVVDGELRIELEDGARVTDATLQAEVTVDVLKSVEVDSGSHVLLTDGLPLPAVDLVLAGGSKIEGPLTAVAVNAVLSGGSRIDASGDVGAGSVQASGGSVIEAEGLSFDALHVELSGGSRVVATVDGSLDAVLSGASALWYGGNPDITRSDVSGGSTIRGV